MQSAYEYLRQRWAHECAAGGYIYLCHLRQRPELNGTRVWLAGGDVLPDREVEMKNLRYHVLLPDGSTIRVLPRNHMPEKSWQKAQAVRLLDRHPDLRRKELIRYLKEAISHAKTDSVMSVRPDCVARLKFLQNALRTLQSSADPIIPEWECKGMGEEENNPGNKHFTDRSLHSDC